MNLKPLLKRQKLRVDPHGHSESLWDDSRYEIHLHKTTKYTIDGKICEVNIYVPLNRANKVRCEEGTGKGRCERRIPIPKQLEKEIQKAFTNDVIRTQFVEELRRELRNYPSEDGEEKQIRAALQRIGHAFGINTLEESAIIEFYQSKDKSYNMIVKDDNEFYKLTSNKEGIELQDWEYHQRGIIIN